MTPQGRGIAPLLPKLIEFPVYSPRERLADALVHALGVGASLCAVTAMMVIAIPDAGALAIVSLVVYGLGLLATFSASASYNLVAQPARKALLRRLDHAAIFLMIAGTYTPFALVSMGGMAGLLLCLFVWLIAALGMVVKLLLPGRFERASIVLYLALGWSILAALEPLVSAVSVTTLVLLVTGGLVYSVGVAFHLWHRLPYQNVIWHGLVLAAAGCHYAAVLDSVALA